MEISRFLCHKLRILCVRKSEIWHAWVRFIPQTALVRAFHYDTKFLLDQFSTKNWCYIIPFPHRIMFDDVLRICYRKFESEFQQMQSHKYKERCKRCNHLDVSQLLHLCQPLIWRCWVAQNSFSHKFNFSQAKEIALKNENSNKF